MYTTEPRPEPAWSPWVYRLGLLLLCSAYLQGGFNKTMDFGSAVAEMRHFGLAPAVPLALATIVLELVASLMVIAGTWRWLAALALAAFTLCASFLANAFWAVGPAERFAMENAFFEHLGLVGAFVLVAWVDLRKNDDR